MSSKLSVAEVLANLESRAAFHRERETFHAQQEEQHRVERARHAAELEKVLHNLETFRAASSSAVELVQQPQPQAPAPAETPWNPRPPEGDGEPLHPRRHREPGGRRALRREPVTAEVNRRFADRLRRPIDTRMASDVLRRMNSARQIRLVRPGKAFSEALYARGARTEEG